MVTHESGGHHHPPSGFIRKYIFSLDHKVIGIQYYFLALFSVFVGMALSMLMRIHLVWPNAKMPFTPGGQMTPEQYLALVTMHGSIMVFMVLTTAPQSGFGNYMLPIQIGAEDMAFPVLNMLSFWTTFVSLVVLVSAFFVRGGAPISGWTAYPTLSALGEIAGPGQGAGQNLWIIGVAIFCIGSLLGALNFITTTVDLRAKRHDLGAHAANGLGLACDRDTRAACVRRTARCVPAAVTRPRGWNELFHSRRARRDRYAHRFAHRWFAAALAALILVLRASRGLHRHPSGDGRGLARPFHVLT